MLQLSVVSCQLSVGTTCRIVIFSDNWQLPTGNLFLSLLLLMLGIGADDPHDSFAADDLAILADPPNAASHFHDTVL